MRRRRRGGRRRRGRRRRNENIDYENIGPLVCFRLIKMRIKNTVIVLLIGKSVSGSDFMLDTGPIPMNMGQ